ncbi:ras-related protein Rab-22A isoform X1 [Python bivittatus]|uniref:Ras-related protein Rab-22A isoform X1 n=1 Tax=Python bivittatus TaxID=176946 RepID=A0A9F5MXL2_PYTBI|nr:ras-related protein Rab-22A isoform X1 [Python bivittatus]
MALRELKVCLLGDTGVGKSSIVWRFVEDSFDPNINPTIGASFMTKTVQYQNELHKFLIWDTAGQERFRALAPMYYRGSAAAIIVYDITKEETFSTLKNWVKELRQHGPPNIVVAIAGNKCDLNDVREVIEKDAKDYADSIHAIFVETSAKNAININELFIEISRRIPSTDANPPSSGRSLNLILRIFDILHENHIVLSVWRTEATRARGHIRKIYAFLYNRVRVGWYVSTKGGESPK